ncbi:MAG: tyrosine-type recombinase/integrase [Myxococcales bacterium]|nr:tyrosine-type recombinase/integrase [Myxococcales bacterium]
MNRSIDTVVKQARRTGKRVAQRLREQETQALAQVCAAREQGKAPPPTLRVWGPYQEGDQRFRLKVAESGVERSLTFRSLDEAEEVKADLLRRHGGSVHRTVGEVVKEWLAWCVEVRGVKPITVENYSKMTVRLPQCVIFGQVTESDARKLYQHQIEAVSAHTKRPVSVATHHLFLWVAKRLWAFGLSQGYSRTNPWAKISPVGRKPTGKAQLRIDEARRFEAVALSRAQAGDVPALGALLMMYLGLRQGEVAARVARDIDDGGRVLWVPSGKTKNARRRLKIPEHLRPIVLAVMEDKRPDELIFYPAHHQQHRRQFYINHVKRLCRLAGVPEVVPHSLRGLHATLALEGGATADAVAKALGHSSFAMTAQHYASPSSVANSRSSRVADALSAHNQAESQDVKKVLKNMSPKDLLALLDGLVSMGVASRISDDKFPT